MIEDVPRRSSDNCCGWRESCPPLISPCASSRVAKRPRLRCASDLQMHFVKGQTSSETVGPQNDSRDLDNSLRPISLASRPRCVSSSTKQVILAAPDEACSSTDSGRHYPLDIRPSAVGRCHRCAVSHHSAVRYRRALPHRGQKASKSRNFGIWPQLAFS
jgi:hypothetical protein